MTKLQSNLQRACEASGLRILFDTGIIVGDNSIIQPLAFIPDLGAEVGMIIVTDYKQIKSWEGELARLGYAYSTISEPGATEEFDLESYQEMFTDWG